MLMLVNHTSALLKQMRFNLALKNPQICKCRAKRGLFALLRGVPKYYGRPYETVHQLFLKNFQGISLLVHGVRKAGDCRFWAAAIRITFANPRG